MTARLRGRLVPAGVVLAGLAVYANSFTGAFVLDDLPHIVDNPGIRSLWPPGAWRPLTMWTFALNYATGGLEPAGYHAVNLLIHLLAALTLFVLIRDTLRLPRNRGAGALDPVRTAGTVALLWTVHPLQTESVTYIVQRGESLAGLGHLLVLVCSLRAWQQPDKWNWLVAAWVTCVAGMAAKESMVVAPVAVILYDRVWLYPSFAAAWRNRAGLWTGLALSWVLLAMLTPPAATYTAAGAGPQHVYMYVLTQPGVILHYLRLSVWPVGLVLEEAWPLVSGIREAIPAAVVLGVLLGGVLGAGRHHPGILAVVLWGGLALAPTSTLIPLRDPAVEHRMYLPLAAVMIVVVLAGASMIRRLGRDASWNAQAGTAVVLVAASLLGWQTIRRNAVYQSQITMYQAVVAQRPGSLRGYQNLAVALINENRLEEAREQLEKLVTLKPDYAEGYYNLGFVLARLGRITEAKATYRTALRYKPGYVPAQVNLDLLLKQ